MGCCKESSRLYLTILNGFLALIGLTLVGLGIYGIVENKEVLESISSLAPYAPVAVGGLVLCLALMGLFGARSQNKPVLVAYWVLMTVATLAIMALGSIIVVYLGLLEDVGAGQSQIDTAAGKVNDFEMAVFAECCGSVPPLCENVTQTSGGCIVDQSDFEDFTIDEGFCNALDQVTVSGVEILGNPGGCSNPVVFHQLFSTFIEDNLTPIGSTFIAVSCLMLLVLVTTCVLICTNRYDYDPEYRARVQQQDAGMVAGTQPVKYN